MTKLEKWYQENHINIEGRGIKLTRPLGDPSLFLDGEFGPYMFRFIDRGDLMPDIEIVDMTCGETIKHSLLTPQLEHGSVYDAAIEFIYNLTK